MIKDRKDYYHCRKDRGETMRCLKCGRNYDDYSIKFCIQCRIPLLRFEPEEQTTSLHSTLDVTDGGGGSRLQYLKPEHAYDTELIRPILDVSYRFLKGESDIDELSARLESTREVFITFKDRQLPEILDKLEIILRNGIAEEFSRQVIYLVRKGITLFEEGIGDVESFKTDENRESLLRGVLKMQEGNDYIALAEEVIKSGLKEL